jgi:hypothetical protein
MKRIASVLSVLFLAACGDVDYTYNQYYTTDGGTNDSDNTADAGPSVDAGPTIKPEFTFELLENYTTQTSIRASVRNANEEMQVAVSIFDLISNTTVTQNYTVVPNGEIFPFFDSLKCGHPYLLSAIGNDRDGQISPIYDVGFKPTDCTIDSTPPEISLLSFDTTATTTKLVIEVDEDATVTYGIVGFSPPWTMEVAGKQQYVESITSITCGTAPLFFAQAQDRAGNKAMTEYALVTMDPCPTPPEMTLEILNDFTTATSARASINALNKDATAYWYVTDFVSFSLEGYGFIAKGFPRTPSLDGLTCNTAYYISVWGQDYAGNKSARVIDTFTTKPCPVSPLPTVGALRVTTLANPVAQTLVLGTTGATLASFELNAGVVGSTENPKIPRLTVRVTTGGASTRESDIGNLTMYDSNGNQFTTTASTAIGAAANTFNFTVPIIVPKSGSVTLTLKGDVLALSGISGVETLTYAITLASDVVAVGADTGNSIIPTLGIGAGQPMTLSSAGTLRLSLVSGSNASPATDQTANVGTTGLPILAVKMVAGNEDMKPIEATLEVCGSMHNVNNLGHVELFLDSSLVPFATTEQMGLKTIGDKTCLATTWTAVDNLLLARIERGTTPTIFVKANVGQGGQVVLGDNFKAKMTMKAKGAMSGVFVDAIGAPEAAGLTTIVPFNVTITAEAPSPGSSQTQYVGAGTPTGRFKVVNYGTAQIGIPGPKYTDICVHTGNTTTNGLKYSDQTSNNYTANTACVSNGSVDFSGVNGGAPIFSIDGGAYRYLTTTIKDIGGAVSGDCWELTVAKLGDATYCVIGYDLGYAPKGDGDYTQTVCGLPMNGRPSLGVIVKQLHDGPIESPSSVRYNFTREGTMIPVVQTTNQ